MREWLVSLPRRAKKSIAISVDLVGFSVCAYLSGWILVDPGFFTGSSVLAACLAVAVVTVLFAWRQNLYRSIVRFMGSDVFVAAAKTALESAALSGGLLFIAGLATSPLRWALIFASTSFIFVCTSRYFVRQFLIKRKTRLSRERVVIYGAGEAGSLLATDLLGGDQYLPVGVIDDDPALRGETLQGLNIYSPAEIQTLIAHTGATKILLAIPGASRRRRRELLDYLSNFPVHVQTMPELAKIISGQAKVEEISDVDVKDILGRDPVPPISELLQTSIKDKNVLVTGAGGSIGSELCRQILRLNPRRLILFEISEVALYEIEKELKAVASELGASCEIVALLGSVQNRHRVDEILVTFNIDTVYHAAAYKHVPVVEQNILEGVHNNIFGTYFLAKAAIAAKVSTFVLISTDKAVLPTSVMGATKRFAELILQALQDDHQEICFCMVRFGNVLESSGSVVPLFRNQIRAGGPVTVTHRDIIRYFMTIPEAAELVIQAAAMAEGGDVFVLDMGEPVRIVDLATRMIRLMGLTIRDEQNPDGDIRIEFTGLRPAEKLYEELLIGSDVSGTQHPRILRAKEEWMPADKLLARINELRDSVSSLDRDRTREILLSAVRGYGPVNGIEDLVWAGQQLRRAQATSAVTVLDFPKSDG